MGLNKPNNEIDTSMLAQESTSQEIKLSTESIKAVADEILSRMGLTNDTGGGTSEGSVFAKLNALQGSVSGVDTDVTSIKNTIGTPASGETVVSLLDDIKGSSGGNKKKFVSSTTNVLLSETINLAIEENTTQILQKSGKTLALKMPMSGEIAIKIVSDVGRYESLSVKAISLNSGTTLGYVGLNNSLQTNIESIYVKEGDCLIFAAYSNGGRTDVETIQILGEIVDANNDLAFQTLNGSYSSYIN